MNFKNVLYILTALLLLLGVTSCGDEILPPEAGFSFSAVELEVNFTNTSSESTSYAWDFGDGNTSTETNPTHIYSEAGAFTVKLVASNDEGTSSNSQIVSVAEVFVAPTLGYTLAFKATGDSEPEFIVTVDDIMNGTIDAVGQGIEQTGWRFYYPSASTLFASGYSADNQCAGYAHDGNGNVAKVGGFIFENALEMFGSDDVNGILLAMEIPRSGFTDRRLHFVDAKTSFVTKIVGTRIYENTTDSLIAWPTALKVRGDKLYVPFQKLDAKGFFSTPAANEALIAVYDYPDVGIEPIKIISDTRTSNIGVNGATTGLISTDNGDLYSFSCGAEMAGFAPAATAPSGILRIPNGETEFDPNYFFNIEEAAGGKIFWFDHIGGNKAIARILESDDAGPWAAYGRDVFNQRLVIIDLADQTVTNVSNVPLHAKRYSSPAFTEDGKVYVSIETATDAHIYQVDIETATGIQGAKINGKTIKGIFRL